MTRLFVLQLSGEKQCVSAVHPDRKSDNGRVGGGGLDCQFERQQVQKAADEVELDA